MKLEAAPRYHKDLCIYSGQIYVAAWTRGFDSRQRLPTYGVPRFPWIGASYSEARQRVDHDRVHSSVVVLDAVHLIPLLTQRVHGLRGNPIFEVKYGPYLRSGLRTPAVLHPRLSDGLLNVHMEVDNICDHLNHALPDSVAPGCSNSHIWLAVLQHNDRTFI
jgi:hypothetical protein